MSQESLRYVRLTDIPFEHPDFVNEDPELKEAAESLLQQMEGFLRLASERTGLDDQDVNFHYKKTITSAMRRYAPDGLATSIGWTANIRTLRHVLELRTAPGAEVEMRRVFDQVGKIMLEEAPALFGDFTRDSEGTWRTPNHKV